MMKPRDEKRVEPVKKSTEGVSKVKIQYAN
jgi:hypothetical protein